MESLIGVLPRKLEDRSKMIFEFPTKDEQKVAIPLPFFENPIITESKAAKYAEHNPIGRGSPIFSYIGAKARKIDIIFNLTLDHLITYSISLNKYVISPNTSTDKRRKEFLKPGTTSQWNAKNVVNEYRLAIEDSLGTTFRDFGLTSFDRARLSPSVEIREATRREQTIDIVMFWLNLIRSSVLNNASNPIYGPPVIRLVHGIMYRYVPCICTAYNISLNEDAGYDLFTMLGKQITIKMSLLEHRVGNFGNFIPGRLVERDNLAGWEALITDEHGTLDPQNITLNEDLV